MLIVETVIVVILLSQKAGLSFVELVVRSEQANTTLNKLSKFAYLFPKTTMRRARLSQPVWNFSGLIEQQILILETYEKHV